MNGITIAFWLNEEHAAMLEAMCSDADVSRCKMAKDLLIAVLEDDAAAHGVCPSPDQRAVILQFRGRGA